MGADVYLSSIRKQFNAKFDERHASERQSCIRTGYFRSSYNFGDVMWAMGLSWWGTVVPMLEDDFWLPVQAASELLTMIGERPLTKERLARHYLQNITSSVNEHPATGPVSRLLRAGAPELGAVNAKVDPLEFEAWARFLRICREELIAILRKSVELDERLFCDL